MSVFKNISLCAVAIIAMVITSCTTTFEEIRHSDGNANFTSVVAIGGSHLSGYSDHALYVEAQTNSIPAILNERFSFANGGSFRQPLVNAGAGIGIQGNARYVLNLENNPCGTGSVTRPRPYAISGDLSNYNWVGNLFPFNNLAVPNTRIKDLSNQSYGNPSPFLGNPLYALFASTPGSSTITGDALLVNPTFVVLWIGLEDVFNYARSGGMQGNDSITSTSNFDMLYQNLVDELSSQIEGGVLLNIPSLNSFPFFTEIGYNDLVLNAQKAAELNALYAGVDTSIKFNVGNNNYVIADPAVPSGRRHIKKGEFILLSTPIDSINCFGWGTTVPIAQRYVLDSTEVLQIRNAIISFNASITLAAVNYNLALVDIQAYLESLNDGMLFNGVHYSSDYLTGGVYSTEGFYFSQRGAALVANEVIESINNFYGAKLPKADANSFPAIIFP